jgi:hypothetical protein
VFLCFLFLSLPGIGAKGADKILELREAKGDLELDDLNQVPYLRITPQLFECLDFTSFENKELEKGEVVSYAEEVCSKVESIGIQKVEVAEQGGQENGKWEIPEHLTNLFDKSKGELNGQEQTQLSELLCEFEDVFAKSEFDLGKFNTIQHGIDTGTNRPVKQRIRRTPLGFAGEEEA